jgi:Tol biopolymer transport system component
VSTTTQKEGSLEPMVSPDGKEIVYKVDKQNRAADEGGIISTDLMIVPVDGGKPKLLARVKGGARWPSWDPSGSRIAFTLPDEDAVMEVNADGSCMTKVYSAPRGGAVFGVAWQPGAERGAGPISC